MTDAGTPAISDPGEDLVRLCAENGVDGAGHPRLLRRRDALWRSAGLPTGRFTFEGFLSANKKEPAGGPDPAGRRSSAPWSSTRRPTSCAPTLADMLEPLRARPAGGAVPGADQAPRGDHPHHPGPALWRCTGRRSPRGEYVLVVAGAPRQEAPALTLAEGVAMVQSLRQQGQRMKDAVRRVAEDTGLSRNELYQAALQEE